MATLPSVPGVPSPVTVKDTEVAAVLRPLKESVDIIANYLADNPIIPPVEQNPNTAAEEGKDASGNPIYYINGIPVSDGYDPTTDYTPPPIPTGLSVQGAFTNILLEWNPPPEGYRNHAYTEVWRSTSDALGAATLIGFAPGSVYADPVGTRQTYYYWIRYVSQANITGPYNGIGGTVGQTALDPTYVLETLSGQITNSQLYQDLAAKISLIDAPDTIPGSVSARITEQATLQQEATSAVATQLTQVSASVGENTAAIQVEATTRASVDSGLLAQYTVKVDVNGRVAGFGLASTSAGGTPISEFVVIADKFAVVSPTSTGETPKVPFVIGTVDGITRVAMANAFIQDAAISNAKIANLAVDSAKIANAAIVTAKIADANITTAKIADANITNAKIADAAITNAKIGIAAIGAANIIDGNITNAKIQNGAITNAKIGNAEITGAKIASATITDANIASATITSATIANGAITSAKIQDAAITSAKIGLAQVDTLQIADVAVTAPAYSFGQVSDLTLNYTLTGPFQSYQLFILGSLVQSFFSQIFLTINGVQLWGEQPLAGTLATRGVVFSVNPGFYQIRLYSTDGRNTNGTSIYVLATKR